ncbi:MAG: YfhO family protein [candidate division WOR-3 bacterium]|uniref:YfhO family protein n=1 Tax=candidate division WOR-3 bacterium TaxID=2052148 RepID=A0A7C1N979_UNCW3|nr:YfhO family protein [candidate division WOR-3 bacterium]
MKRRSRRPPVRPPIPVKNAGLIRKLLPHLVLSLAVLVYFWNTLNGRSFFWEDILYQYYPFHYFLFNQLRQLTIPVWNPYMFGGMPFLADIQTQVFYPLNWLLAFLSTSSQRLVFWIVEFKCILHILLGGVGFYLLMRELRASPLAGLISGMTFAFSGFMIMHIIHLTLISTFAWFPLILLFFYRTLSSRHIRDALVGGMLLGIANLAGHPQMTLHMVYALGFLFLLHIISSWRAERRLILTTHLPLFLLSILTGFALAACAYLPSYRFSSFTVRELMTYAESAELSLSPSFLITIFIPKFFGSITGSGTDTVEFWGNPAAYSYWETAVYFGIIPFFLGIIGIAFSKHRLRWHFALLALVALLLALGKYTPFYRLTFELLPGFNRFRIPARFINLFTIAFAFFAGQGIDVLLNSKLPVKRLLIPGFGLLAYAIVFNLALLAGAFNRIFPALNETSIFSNALKQSLLFVLLVTAALFFSWLTLRNRGKSSGFAAILLVVSFLDLYQFGHRFNQSSVGPEEFYPRRPFIDQLVQESRTYPFRINARVGQYMVLQRNEGLLWQLELLEGYTPLKLIDYVTFDIPQQRKNNLLNVRYQIMVDSVNRSTGLVRNPDALPRVWLTDTFVVVKDRREILTRLSEPDFDYRRIAVLEKTPEPLPEPDSLPAGSITIVQRQPEKMMLHGELKRATLLMISEIFYPDWRATIDGRPAEILRADYCLRALALPAGTHTVILYYDRQLLNIGLFISIVTLLAVSAILFIFPRFRNKGSAPHLSSTKTHQ